MGAHEQGAEATAGRWLTVPRTLCFVLNGDDVLLIKRASHMRVFPNRYNGLGGHIERYEDPLSGARREIMEESGLVVTDLSLRAVYNIDAGGATGIILFVFTAYSASRNFNPVCDEGALYWIPSSELVKLDLVEDLPQILPRILDMDRDDPPWFVHVSYNSNDSLQMRFADE